MADRIRTDDQKRAAQFFGKDGKRLDGTDALYVETQDGIERLTKAPKERPRMKAPKIIHGGVRDVTPKGKTDR